ncbi:MAG: hypothetical protein EOO10_08025 [Chitinophagaceae bacterium]|nr:MAG: hypothetical protein EOO10_08025 [Chitinophagaceae bacterium]
MRLLIGFSIALVFFSCAKTSTDTETPQSPAPTSGAVRGSIKVFDRYGNENANYNDISLKLIDKQSRVMTALVGTNGTFSIDNISFGDVTLTIRKPGYGFTDSVKFSHQRVADTLSSISLIEELPFSFNLFSAGYTNGMLRFSGSYSYQSTESYMVSEFLCFSKDPNVSINRTNLFWSPSSQTNVQFITGTSGGSTSLALKTLTDAGFITGDKIYVCLFPSITKFWSSYYDQTRNYTILRYKVSNASNVVSFTLN